MARRRQADIPFCLGYWPGWICANGSRDANQELLTWPGAAHHSDGYVMIPESRQAFLAVEAVAAIASATDEYREARIRFMSVSMDDIFAAHEAARRVGLKVELLPQQEEFVALAMRKRSYLNASEQGTGKTLCGWLLPAIWGSRRLLVITNSSLIPQWGTEMMEYWENPEWNEAPFRYVSLTQPVVAERSRLLERFSLDFGTSAIAAGINYECLDDMLPALLDYSPDCVVFDESWKIANHKSKRWQAALRLCGSDSARVLELTGTPVCQSPASLWAQLRLLGEDAMPLSYDQFVARYCRQEPRRYGGWQRMVPVGASDPMGLMARIEPVYYRATAATCAQLPPVHPDHIVRLDMGEDQAMLYRAIEEHGEAALNPLSLAGDGAKRLRLHQVAGGFRPVPQDPDAPRTIYNCEPFGYCPKWEWLRRFLVENGYAEDRSQRLIVWAAYTHELVHLTRLIGGWLGHDHVAMVWGGMKTDLEQVKASFNSRNRHGIQVICAQLEKLSAGHNLQKGCHKAVYYSLNWRRITHSQSRKRIHRQGQVEPVDYYYLVSTGGNEEDIDLAIYDRHQSMEDMADRISPDTVGMKSGNRS
jgi:hypothetical protein